MAYRVVVTDDARRDIEDICDYIAGNDSIEQAERIADRILKLVRALAEFPERGAHPRELAALGLMQYRQVLHHPWRVIYTIGDSDIVIHLIADGRRDMCSLLTQRLLDA
jgi:toxin ParE1/3/4